MKKEKSIYLVGKFTLGDIEEFKRVEVYYDGFENDIIFRGYCGMKASTGIKVWDLLVEKRFKLEKILESTESKNNLNFNKTIEEIYELLIEKEKTLELLKGLFKDVDQITIKNEEDETN